MLFQRCLGAAGHVIGVHVNDRKKRGRGRRGGTSPRKRLPENVEALRPGAGLFFG